MKISGKELREWMDNAWPGEEWYWDHAEFDEFPDENTSYCTGHLGDLFHHDDRNKSISLVSSIKKWRESRTHLTLIVECPIGKVDAVKALLREHGCGVK